MLGYGHIARASSLAGRASLEMERRWRLHALLVLCSGFAFTTLVVSMLITTNSARDRAAFEANARLAQEAVIERVKTSIALLRGTAGLVSNLVAVSFASGTDLAAFARLTPKTSSTGLVTNL